MAVHAFDPSRQGQANLCELEARLISLCEFHDGQGYTEVPCITQEREQLPTSCHKSLFPASLPGPGQHQAGEPTHSRAD